MLLEHLCTSSAVAAGQRCEQGGAKHKRRYQLKPATWLLQFAVLVCTMTMAEAKPWPSQTANSMLNTSEVKVTEAFLHHPETQDRWVNLTAIPNDSSAYTNCSGQCGPPHLPLEHLVQRFLDTCDEMQNHVRFYVLILTGIFLMSCAATSFLATAGHKRRRDRRRLHRKHHPQQQQQQRRRCISPAKTCASTRRKSARGTSQRHRSRQQRQRRLSCRTTVTWQMLRKAHVRPTTTYRKETMRRLCNTYSLLIPIKPSRHTYPTYHGWEGEAGGAATTKKKRQSTAATEAISFLEAVEALTRTIRLGMLSETKLPTALKTILGTYTPKDSTETGQHLDDHWQNNWGHNSDGHQHYENARQHSCQTGHKLTAILAKRPTGPATTNAMGQQPVAHTGTKQKGASTSWRPIYRSKANSAHRHKRMATQTNPYKCQCNHRPCMGTVNYQATWLKSPLPRRGRSATTIRPTVQINNWQSCGKVIPPRRMMQP